jgi:DNA-binding MarR family transcriptional regulator
VAERHQVLIALLRDVHRGIFELVHKMAGSPGAGAARLLIIKEVGQHPGSTVSDLARTLGLAKSHVSTTVDQLADSQLVEKRTDQRDQRVVRIFPTQRSCQLFSQIDAVLQRRVDAALDTLSSEQENGLLVGLQALQTAISQDLPLETAERVLQEKHEEGYDERHD